MTLRGTLGVHSSILKREGFLGNRVNRFILFSTNKNDIITVLTVSQAFNNIIYFLMITAFDMS